MAGRGRTALWLMVRWRDRVVHAVRVLRFALSDYHIQSFSLLDTIFSKKYVESDGKTSTYSTASDSSLFESRLGLRSIVKDIKNVIVRPPKASKDVLPASRHELIWKPTLGVFDVSVNHVSYDIRSPHSHHSFMVVLW